MNKNITEITFDNVPIKITQKRIKSMRIRISPPQGEVNVSAPWHCNLNKITDFIKKKISWIKYHRQRIIDLKIEPAKKILDGELHYFFGEKFLLKVSKTTSPNRCFLEGNIINVQCKKNLNFKERQKLLDDFYRRELKKIIPPIIAELEEKMQVKVAKFGIKKMKTRWGTCNPRARRIWINLELAKRSISCLKYLITHEMIHFFVKGHNKTFYNYMDIFAPNWKEKRAELRQEIR